MIALGFNLLLFYFYLFTFYFSYFFGLHFIELLPCLLDQALDAAHTPYYLGELDLVIKPLSKRSASADTRFSISFRSPSSCVLRL